MFGLLVERALALADLPERVASGFAFPSALGGHAGAKLEATQLLGGQRRPRERVVLAVGDKVPAEAGELACSRDDSDLHPAARADSLIERAQRAWCLGRRPCGLDEHPARVRATLFGDPPVRRGLSAGLAHPGVEPEVADELLGRAEATEVADRGDDRERDGRVDTGDRHQPLDLSAGQRDAAELGVDDPQLLAVEVKLAQQRLHCLALIRRQRLLRQPRPALVAEQIGGRATRQEVAVQDRLDLVLQPRALAHDMRPPRDLTTERVRLVVRQPHPREIVRGE